MDKKALCAEGYGLRVTGLLPLTEQADRVFCEEGSFLLYRGRGPGFVPCLHLQEQLLRREALQTLQAEKILSREEELFCLIPADRMTQCLQKDLVDPMTVMNLLRILRADTPHHPDVEPAGDLPRKMERAFQDMLDFSAAPGPAAGQETFYRYIDAALKAAAHARSLVPRDLYRRLKSDPGEKALCLRDLRPENFLMDKDGQLTVLSVFSAAPGLAGDDMARLIRIYAPTDPDLAEKLLRARGLSQDALTAVIADVLFPWDFWSVGYRCLARRLGDADPLQDLKARQDLCRTLAQRLLAAPVFPDPSPDPPRPSLVPGPLSWTFPKGR